MQNFTFKIWINDVPDLCYRLDIGFIQLNLENKLLMEGVYII
jgi:hypothetical protein